MAFWSGEKLLENRFIVRDFSPSQVDVNAYNLRLGNSYFLTSDEDAKGPQKRETLKDGESFVIPAGQFAFLLSKETIEVPANAMALISMRTKVKFKGLINVSGFHVDPGYAGNLVFTVFNAGPLPIQLTEGDSLFKIWFADLDRQSSKVYSGKPLTEISEDLTHGMGKEVYSLQTLADKIRDVKHTLETKFAEQKPTIDFLTFVYRALLITAAIGAVGVIWPIAVSTGSAVARWVDGLTGAQIIDASGQPADITPDPPPSGQ